MTQTSELNLDTRIRTFKNLQGETRALRITIYGRESEITNIIDDIFDVIGKIFPNAFIFVNLN